MNELDGRPEVDPPLPAGAPTRPAPSGQPRVDAAMAELARAEGLTPDQQIETYESVHRALQDALRSIEQT
jgi:uncharacterized protein (DUF2267 family)